jgi:hypothetical protein
MPEWWQLVKKKLDRKLPGLKLRRNNIYLDCEIAISLVL